MTALLFLLENNSTGHNVWRGRGGCLYLICQIIYYFITYLKIKKKIHVTFIVLKILSSPGDLILSIICVMDIFPHYILINIVSAFTFFYFRRR
jgi:hypothetical protein